MNYPFPDDIRNPDWKKPNPFADDADCQLDQSGGASGEEDPFVAGDHSTEYRPQYETTYANRAGLVLALGLLGMLLSLLGWLTFAGHAEVGLMPLLSLAFSLTATITGMRNLRTIASGAMQGDRRGWLVGGVLIGIFATFNSAIYLLISIWLWDLFG